jgi:Rhs element Vgr protein
MPNERTIPSEAPRGAATFTILSEGNAVPRSYQVLSIVTNKEVNRIPVATITIMDGSASEQTFGISNKPDFEPGKKIEIKAGYQGTEETIFKGIVIRHSIKIREQSSVLMIECKDEAVKMTVACKNKYYRDSTDSDIIESLIDNHGVDKTVEPTTLTHKEVVQYNTTDWDFMLCRTDMNGLLCIPDDGKISVAKPELSGDPVLTVQFGATVYDLDAEIDARLQFKKITATAWKPAEQALIEGIESEDPGVPDVGNLSPDALAGVIAEEGFSLQHSGMLEDQELQQWANAKMLKHRLAKVRGKVRIDGSALVLPGKFIELQGVGERFAGKLFVTGVRHEIESGSWRTVCQFGLNPEWFAETYNVQQPMAAAMLPAIEGLQIGVVTKLEGDPDGEDRIMVRLPIIQAEDDGIWSRIATLDAGNNRGTFFRPEIGDEVIVGFINNDPRHAVILGMCNSSKKPAPLPASDDNHEKGYVSRSEMKVIFNDDKKTITIQTPGGNKLLISDDEKKIHMEDQNGNKFTMDQDGIKMESVKDIVLKAATDIKAEAGANAHIKGGAQAKLEGGSAAELSSGASTTVKGSIVQIN